MSQSSDNARNALHPDACAPVVTKFKPVSPVDDLLSFVAKREAIRRQKEAGLPPPWTDDMILRQWSFCNVHREDDRGTLWIAKNWRDPNSNNLDLWHSMAVARFLNLVESLLELGWPSPWDRQRFVSVMSARKARGDQVFGAAYKVGTAGLKVDKIEYVADVLDRLWTGRGRLKPRTGDTLAEFHSRLVYSKGLGSFMAAQIVADMKYVAPLIDARDWMTFAASGPGSRRGLNRVLGRPVEATWREDDWRAALRRLHVEITPELERIGVPRLHAQDLQNCLCEFDKYERARLGEGTPKRRYAPTVLP